jgi:hypothetical protein
MHGPHLNLGGFEASTTVSIRYLTQTMDADTRIDSPAEAMASDVEDIAMHDVLPGLGDSDKKTKKNNKKKRKHKHAEFVEQRITIKRPTWSYVHLEL